MSPALGRIGIPKSAFDELMSIGIDIGKDTFHLVGFDPSGQRVLRQKIKRLALIETFEKLPRCIVGMEACLSALISSAASSARWGLSCGSFQRFT